MRILLTGVTGFVGGHLMPKLARGHEVFALARHPRPDDLPDGVEWIEQDLARGVDLGGLPGSVDAVIQLAQSKRYREFPEGADDMFAVNVRSTFELLEYARSSGASKFVFASTGGVYGSSDRPLSENDRLFPLNFYIATKYSAESLVTSYRQLFHTVVFRFFFVYGPGQTGMMVPSLLQRVAGGDPITIQGDPGIRTNPIYVDDASAVFEPALALEDSDLFNIAGDEAVTIRQLVELMEQATGRDASIESAPGDLDGDLIGDNTRMKDVLGVTPSTPLLDGLRSMV
jgi:nucleoside-diphosphate-sugar epimerase